MQFAMRNMSGNRDRQSLNQMRIGRNDVNNIKSLAIQYKNFKKLKDEILIQHKYLKKYILESAKKKG